MIYGILIVIIIGLCIAIYFQMKSAKEAAEDGQQLLNDYQKRINELEKLTADFRELQKNFDNVGTGYEQALLAFDKIEEEKQAIIKARNTYEKQAADLLAAKQKLEQAMLKKKELIGQAADSLIAQIDLDMPGASKLAMQATAIQNLNDVELETAIEADDNCLASDITSRAVRISGIDKADYLKFDNQIAEEAQTMMLFTNQAQVTRALVNLLDNAQKFTSSGSVTLLTTTDGSNVEFTVEDTGTGISADDAEKIFEPFTKLNTFFDGAGCGLTVARSIARRLNGDVKLDTSYTGGARFVLTLPL